MGVCRRGRGRGTDGERQSHSQNQREMDTEAERDRGRDRQRGREVMGAVCREEGPGGASAGGVGLEVAVEAWTSGLRVPRAGGSVPASVQVSPPCHLPTPPSSRGWSLALWGGDVNSWWPGAVSWFLPHGMNGSSSLFSFGGEGKGPGKRPQSDRSREARDPGHTPVRPWVLSLLYPLW